MGRAILLENVPQAFRLPRDPKDEPYVDLAIAAKAAFLVTWNDRHLTYLMRKDTPEGINFCQRFPDVRIVNPIEFVSAIRTEESPPSTTGAS
jgi:uncharacterized protein